MLCFGIQIVLLLLLSCCRLVLSEYQSSERKPAYGVERALRAFQNYSCLHPVQSKFMLKLLFNREIYKETFINDSYTTPCEAYIKLML